MICIGETAQSLGSQKALTRLRAKVLSIANYGCYVIDLAHTSDIIGKLSGVQ